MIGEVGIQRLAAGDELRCPRCRQWHPLIQKHSDGTEATVRMLYFECRGLPYFGRFVGAGSRHESRKATRSARGISDDGKRPYRPCG